MNKWILAIFAALAIGWELSYTVKVVSFEGAVVGLLFIIAFCLLDNRMEKVMK